MWYETDFSKHNVDYHQITSGDLTGDGQVDRFDLAIVLNNWVCPVPPAD